VYQKEAFSAPFTRNDLRCKAMATAEREKFTVCEVKRRRVRAAGGYEPFWKVKNVAEAIVDEDTEFRCKDCGGAVKLVRRRGTEGMVVAHIEHKLKNDSEYCLAGLGFLKSTDGRIARMSDAPVR
jgi:hypothetical protein